MRCKLHKKKHELTLKLTSRCHISLDKLPKLPTVLHKDVISSSEKRSDKKSLVLTHPVGISPGFSPGISPVLCSPASRPKKRPFNTKPLGDKHCLQRLALDVLLGIQRWAGHPRCVSKLMALKESEETVSETGFLFNSLWAGKKTLILRQHPQILQIASKVAERAPWSGKVEKQNKQWMA